MGVGTLNPSRGLSYTGSVYRDAWKLIHSSTNDEAFSNAAFLDGDTVEAAIDAARDGTINGYFEMGPADMIRMIFGGTDADNEEYSFRVSGLCPILEKVNGELVARAWVRSVMWTGAVTLGATTAGAVGALVTGIASGDFIADTLSETDDALPLAFMSPGGQFSSGVQRGSTPGYPAHLKIPMLGCPFGQLETDLNTAASAWAIAKRAGGHAYPGKGGGG